MNSTALGLAAVPTEGAHATPQAPAGAAIKSSPNVSHTGGWVYRDTFTFILVLFSFFTISIYYSFFF